MEFIGNRLNFKTIAATLSVAFLIGRAELAGGAFPAAVAFITVMTGVSTVYIYTVPALLAGMCSHMGKGMYFYGDVIALVICAALLLLFSGRKPSVGGRTGAAVISVLLGHCVYYGAAGIFYLFSLLNAAKECAALIVYISAFHTIAQALFAEDRKRGVPEEKTGLAYGILLVSLIGALEYVPAVLFCFMLISLLIAYCKGIYHAMLFAALGAILWECMGNPPTEAFYFIFTGLLGGWIFASAAGGKYKKTILGGAFFLIFAAVSEGSFIYSAAAASTVLVGLPSDLLKRLWFKAEKYLLPNPAPESDLRIKKAYEALREKRDLFYSLSGLYGAGAKGRQMISYQFRGLGRAMDYILGEISEEEQYAGSKKGFPVRVGWSSCGAGKVSGDSCLSFSYAGHYQAMIISDGMGHGEKAAEESRLAATALSRLLAAGFDADIAVKTLNAMLMGEKGEMFATVDLALIDNVNNRVRMFKMGAAATFIKRGGEITSVESLSPPVGIVDGLKTDYFEIRLKKGDSLVMVSDGVTDCDREDRECQWLKKRLAEIESRDPETIADLVVNRAVNKYGIRERDDMTVMVATF